MTEPEDFEVERERIRASAARSLARKKGRWEALDPAHKKYLIAAAVVVLILLVMLMAGVWESAPMPRGEG